MSEHHCMVQRTSIDINTLVAAYLSTFPSEVRVDSVFLFGSFARGDQREDSDVDLLILSDDFKEMPFIKRLELLSKLRNHPMTGEVAMDIFGYTPEEFERLENESVIMRQAKKEGRFVWKRGDLNQ